MATIAGLADGGFVATWSEGGAYEQRFDADGNARGGVTFVKTVETSGVFLAHGAPVVAALEGGGFVIALNALDGAIDGIFAKHFDAQGRAIGKPGVLGTAADDRLATIRSAAARTTTRCWVLPATMRCSVARARTC